MGPDCEVFSGIFRGPQHRAQIVRFFSGFPLTPHFFERISSYATFFRSNLLLRHIFWIGLVVSCWLDCASELSAHDACAQRPPAGASARVVSFPHNACCRMFEIILYN